MRVNLLNDFARMCFQDNDFGLAAKDNSVSFISACNSSYRMVRFKDGANVVSCRVELVDGIALRYKDERVVRGPGNNRW